MNFALAMPCMIFTVKACSHKVGLTDDNGRTTPSGRTGIIIGDKLQAAVEADRALVECLFKFYSHIGALLNTEATVSLITKRNRTKRNRTKKSSLNGEASSNRQPRQYNEGHHY